MASNSEAQTVIFSNAGSSYTNTDAVTTNNYGPVNVSNCSSISFSMQYNFSLPFPGNGNMESSDECPFGGGCSGDPADAAGGGCANCWDFIYVQFQIGGVTVHTELVGIPGSTNQSGTLSFGPVCTNGAADAGIIVQTQTWAANETITFSNINITCWDASSTLMVNPNPVCSGMPFTLSSVLTNPGSVATTLWSGPGTINSPSNLVTTVNNAPIGTSTYTFTATDDNACTDSNTIDVTVNQGPTLDDPPNLTVCADDPVSVAFTGTGNPLVNWTNSNPAIGLGANGNGDISFTAANVAATATGTITITPSENGCTGPSQSFTITVNPLPTVNAEPNVSVCAGAFVTNGFAGSPGATFTWTNDNLNIGLGASGSVVGAGTFSFTAANVGSTEVANIEVTPSLNGCPGVPIIYTIMVNPAPTVADPVDQSVCAGDPVDVIFSGSVNPVFNWTNTNPAIGLGANGAGDISFTAANVAATTTGTITVTPNEAGCPGPNQSFTITVNPVPNVNQPANVSVCAGANVTTNFSGTAGATFNWINDNPAIGLGASGSGNLNFVSANVLGQEVANLTVTPIINGCPGNPLSFTITVNPSPTVMDPANQIVCAGDPVDVMFSGTVNPSFNWTNNNPGIGLGASGNGDISFTAANVVASTTATITVSPVEAGCPGPNQSFTVTVNPIPNVNQPADVTVCGGTTVTTNFTGSAGATFNWVNNNPAIGLGASGTGNLNFVSAVVGAQEVATITVTPVLNGCPGNPITFNITLNPGPSVADPADQTVCAGDAVAVVFNGTGTLNWTNSNPAIGLGANGSGDINFTAASVGAPSTGIITVTPTLAGCPGPAQNFSITVNPIPSANQPNPLSACAGAPVTLNFTGTAGATFNWVNDNPAIGLGASGSGNLNFTAANVGAQEVANITLTPVLNGCPGNPLNFTITINPAPGVSDPADQTVCAGEQVDVLFNGTGTLNWTNSNVAIGLGSTGSGDISFTAANVAAPVTGIITVTPSLAGCTGPVQSFSITVNPVPFADPPADLSACSGTAVQSNFTGTPGATFTWTNDNPGIGLGATGTGNLNFIAANVPFQEVANITVTPLFNGCPGIPQLFSITVNAAPSVTDPANQSVCSGATVNVLFSGSNNPNFNWTNNNPGIGLAATGSGDISFTAANPGNATITVTPSENGCFGPAQSFDLTVLALPSVNQSPDLGACSGTPVSVNFTGTPGATFSWTNSDPAIGLSAGGTGNLSFTAANVSTSTSGTISVTPNLGACAGPAQVFDITVNPLPSLDILTVGCAPDLLTYSIELNTSGSTLVSSAGTVSGSTGNFTISGIPAGMNVTITSTISATGCEIQQSVNAPNCNCAPVTAPASPNAPVICEGAPIPALTVVSAAGTTIDWFAAPSGGTPLLAGNPAYTPAGAFTPGTYSFYAEARDLATGCTNPVRLELTLTVHAVPTVMPLMDQSVCAGTQVNVNFSGTAAANMNWTNSNASIGLGASGSGNISFLSVNPGATPQIANLTVTPSLNGCAGAVQNFALTINPLPSLTPPIDQVFCGGTPVALNFAGTAGATFDWTNSNPAIGLGTSGSGNIVFVAANVLNPTLANFTVTPTLAGCTGATQNFSLTINPLPTVTTPADVNVCVGNSVSLVFAGTNGASFNWTNSNPAIGLAASGSGDLSFTSLNTGTTALTANLTVTPMLNNCTGVAQNFTITVNPLPSLAVDSTDCSADLSNYTIFVTSNANTLVSSTGTVSGTAPDFQVTSISIANNAQLTVTNTSTGCTQQQTVNAPNCNCAPVNAATSPNNPVICAAAPTPALSVAAAAGNTIDWYASATGGTPLQLNSNSFTPLGTFAPGTYSFYAEARETATGCTSATRLEVVLTVNPLPSVTQPADQNVCAGTQVSINFNGSNSAVFNWTNSNPAIGLAAGGTGNISFMTTNAGASPLLAALVVTPALNGCMGPAQNFAINVNPIPGLSLDSINCSSDLSTYTIHVNTTGDVLTSSAGTVSSNGSNFDISGIPAGTNVVLTVSNSASSCSQQQPVNAPNCNCAPVSGASMPNNPGICAGAATPALTVLAPAGTTVDWFAGASGGTPLLAGNTSFTPGGTLTAGNYNFYAEVRDLATGCTSNTRLEVTLTVSAVPTVSLPASQTRCAGEQVSINFTGSAGATLNWSNSEPAIGLNSSGSGNITFVAVNQGNTPLIANFTVTPDLNSCTGIPQNFSITVNPLPQAAITGNTSICDGTGTTLTATGGSGISWSSGETTASIQVNPLSTQSYTVTVTENSCGSTASALVQVSEPSSATVNAVTCDPALVGTDVKVIPNAAGCDSTITTITTLDNSGCIPAPVLLSGTVSCFGDTDGILTLSAGNGLAPYQYSWSNGTQSGTGTIPASGDVVQLQQLAAGNYTVTITGANGLSSTATAMVTAPALLSATATAQVISGGYPISCAGATDGVVNAAANGGTPPFQYTWSVPGQSSAMLSGLGAGTYQLTVTDAHQCTATSFVTLEDPPALGFDIALAAVDCGANLTTALISPLNGAGPFNVSIDGNLATGGLMPEIPTGNHLVALQDANGCLADTMVLVDLPLAPVISLPAETTIAPGEVLVLEAQTNLDSWESVVWHPMPDTVCLNCLRQVWMPMNSGLYEVIITDSAGCSASASIRVLVTQRIDLYVPNVFAPDSEGDNTLWNIYGGASILNLNVLQIFDRWGDQVYALESPVPINAWPGWDGIFRGDPVNPGVFVYYLEVELINGEKVVRKGDLTVIR